MQPQFDAADTAHGVKVFLGAGDVYNGHRRAACGHGAADHE
ncbi:MAG: hypothetical protein ACKOGB_06025 [Betaproteobacteria bacterium]